MRLRGSWTTLFVALTATHGCGSNEEAPSCATVQPTTPESCTPCATREFGCPSLDTYAGHGIWLNLNIHVSGTQQCSADGAGWSPNPCDRAPLRQDCVSACAKVEHQSCWFAPCEGQCSADLHFFEALNDSGAVSDACRDAYLKLIDCLESTCDSPTCKADAPAVDANCHVPLQ